jgi:hypothetical protein
LEKDAKAVKEDALKELRDHQEGLGQRTSGGTAGREEPRAMAGPYSYTLSELMSHVEEETKLGRDFINGVSRLKATLVGRK